MYQDKSITMGYVSTDEAIQFSGNLPTTAVFAENDISPMIIMWDPKTYPDVTDDQAARHALQAKKGVVRYFTGRRLHAYLIGAGYPARQTSLDGSYDGTPAKFVTDQGKSGQQGFATAEPYIYENEVQAWDKPVKFQLVSETGWQPYPEAMSVRTGDLAKLTPCLKKLVPIMQQADVDYLKSPTPTNTLIDTLVTNTTPGGRTTPEVGDYAVCEMKSLQIAADVERLCRRISAARIESLIKLAAPIFPQDQGRAREAWPEAD